MTVEDLLRYGIPLFRGLTADQFNGRDIGVLENFYEPWELLFNQQDSSRDVYFLLSGTLLAVYWTREGREIIFSRFPAGAYFGELAALDAGARSLAVVAKSKTRVLVMPRDVFLDLFHNNRIIRERVTRDLVKRVRGLTEKNLELTTFSVEQRVASYLIRLAVERNCLEHGGVLEDAPTHAEIAASIGANREMVSRTIIKLSRKGAIRAARQRIELRDTALLSNLI